MVVADDLFKALADPTRRTILDELTEKSGQTLFEICSRLSMKHQLGISRQAVSQHLAVLEAAGLVETRREGRYKFHDLNTPRCGRSPSDGSCPTHPDRGEHPMKIHLTSVFVDDQAKALRFYTEILGFVKKYDVPLGEKDRWLTVVSPDEPGGTELLLEPAGHPAVEPYRDALVKDGIPLA